MHRVPPTADSSNDASRSATPRRWPIVLAVLVGVLIGAGGLCAWLVLSIEDSMSEAIEEGADAAFRETVTLAYVTSLETERALLQGELERLAAETGREPSREALIDADAPATSVAQALGRTLAARARTAALERAARTGDPDATEEHLDDVLETLRSTRRSLDLVRRLMAAD